ncbi:MAG: hypothetical protein K0S32_361 [Bacteroidetes bacterium]|jgi:hypothetical protein|nr:hypothetical protein [Bacteroidota bacterium]
MNVFELSLKEGKPVNISAFEVNLLASPPEIIYKTVNVKKHLPVNELVTTMQYRDANFDEGCLNIYCCRFDTGRCEVHFFGNMKGTELRSESHFKAETLRDFDMLNERIRFILAKSKNILKSYYKDSKFKNLEHHILAFLSDNTQS